MSATGPPGPLVYHTLTSRQSMFACKKQTGKRVSIARVVCHFVIFEVGRLQSCCYCIHCEFNSIISITCRNISDIIIVDEHEAV